MNTVTSASENTVPLPNVQRRRGCLFTIGRVLKWFGIILIVLVLSGVVYQTVATAIDKRSYTPRGTLYTVNGHQMHMVCMGELQAGRPTVILQAGGAADSMYWYWAQKQLEQHTRVCAYDRAGMGWSDAASTPRDPVTIVGELHALLQAADVQPPYIMAGHSYGTILARVYATQYPQEIVGLALIDSFQVDLVDQSEIDQFRPTYYVVNAPLWLMFRLGLVRFIFPGQLQEMGFPPELAQEMAALRSHNGVLDTDIAEKGLDVHLPLARAAAASKDLGALPLAVLWASESYATYDKNFMAEVAAYSSNSVTHVVEGANHGSILGDEQYAQQVTDAILNVIEAAETGEPLAQ